MYNETTRLVKVVMPVDTEEDIQQGETNPILASVNPTRAAGDSGTIMLSDTAESLFIAYEVVAMVKDEETGKTHFSQLRWKKLGELETDGGGGEKSVADPNGDGDGEAIVAKGAMRDGAEETEDEPLYYQFMFESGDLFVAAAADEYPALDGDELQMLSDSSSGGLPDYSQASNGDVLAISSGEPTWTTPSGGGSGGGGAVAHATYEIDETTYEVASIVLDMTFDEIVAAEGNVSVVANIGTPEHTFIAVGRVAEIEGTTVKVIGIPTYDPEDNYYTALTVFANRDGAGHPVWYADGGGPK